MKELVNLDYPNAIRIGVIPDNLHTHNPAFLSAVFETAKPNVSEISWSSTTRLKMDRSSSISCQDSVWMVVLATEETLIQKISCWQEGGNYIEATVGWKFIVNNARIKLRKLYPSIKCLTYPLG